MDVPHNMGVAITPSDVFVGVRPAPAPDWESELVRNCQSGDPDAFRLLVERYQGRVFAVAHSLVRRRDDVEDIAQQVFTKVYFAIHNFDFRCALITWIYRITVNECYDHLRRTRSRRLLLMSEMSEADSRKLERVATTDPTPHQQVELAQTVTLLLEKVSPEDRVLLLMKEVEGYSVENLAQMFGWNQNTVKVKLFRARRKLAQAAGKRLPKLGR